jgi:dolichyldiphosphatase
MQCATFLLSLSLSPTLCLSLSLFLLLRYKPSASDHYRTASFLERLALSIIACVCAGLVAASHVYLNYHMPKQILVECAAGAFSAILWLLSTTFLRRSGLLGLVLKNDLARFLRMRDLTVMEDLAETGRARWESLKAQQSTPNGALKKKSK